MLMHDRYMTVYNSLHDMLPLIGVCICATLIICKHKQREEMQRLKQLKRDIYKARRQLVKERMKLENAKRH